MLKYRLVIHWDHTPSNAERHALVFWKRHMEANNRRFLLETAAEIMKTLRNAKRVDIVENEVVAATDAAE